MPSKAEKEVADKEERRVGSAGLGPRRKRKEKEEEEIEEDGEGREEEDTAEEDKGKE